MGIPKNWDRKDDHNPFTFMIELVHDDDSIKDQLAGANNIIAANAAYAVLPDHFATHEILRLRQGGRIMDRVRGTGEENRKAVERLTKR